MPYKDIEKRRAFLREWKSANKAYLKIQDKEYRIRNKLLLEKKYAAYKKRYPEIYDASQKIHILMRAGKIVREKCESCDRTDTNGHHDDYNLPLSVRWLCPSHHRSFHVRHRYDPKTKTFLPR